MLKELAFKHNLLGNVRQDRRINKLDNGLEVVSQGGITGFPFMDDINRLTIRIS